MSHEEPKVSIIIPCYNQGQYLEEAIASVLAQTYRNFEIVIVDDGSNDTSTLEILKNYNQHSSRVIHTSNQGLACARNNGIKESKGKYILPLDADDKIAPTYLEKAVAILDNNEKVGIVYCEAEFFGTIKAKWELPDYNFPKMLLANLIFCSAFFRKSDWEKTRGYNPNMKFGWEDFDFWLSLIEQGVEVIRIPEILFFYRQLPNSMANSMSQEHWVYSYTQLFNNHPQLYSTNISAIFDQLVGFRKTTQELSSCNDQLKARLAQFEHEIQFLEKERAYLCETLACTNFELKALRNTYTVRISRTLGMLLNKFTKKLSSSDHNSADSDLGKFS